MVMAAGAPAHMWFIRAGGEVWGPYGEARVAAFCREGRVRATTLISPFQTGPWAAAAEAVEFSPLLRPSSAAVAPAPVAAPVRAPLRAQAAPATLSPVPAPRARPAMAPGGDAVRALVVFAELSSVAPAAFQAALERLGGCVQVRFGLWLVRAPFTAASLRNKLSAHLGAKDTLLVVEAALDHAAWFNLAAGDDRHLRHLWGG